MSSEQILQSLPATLAPNARVSTRMSKAAMPSWYSYVERNEKKGGDQSVAISATGTTEVIFDVLREVENLKKSKVLFDITFPAQGANICTRAFVDSPPLDSLELRTKGRKFCVNVEHAVEYWNTCVPACSDLIDIHQRGPVGYGTTVANARVAGTCYFMNLSNNLASDLFQDADGTGVAVNQNKIGDDGTLVVDADENNYFGRTHVMASTANAALVLHCCIELGDFHETMLELDQDLYSPVPLELVFRFRRTADWGFTIDNTAGNVGDDLGAAALAVQPTISNLHMLVAQQANPDVIDSVMADVNGGGLSFKIPYVEMIQDVLGAATNVHKSNGITPGMGEKLKRIYWITRNTDTNTVDRCNLYGDVNDKVLDYQTRFHGKWLQQQEIKADETENYLYNRRLLKGSVLGQNRMEYVSNPVHIDDFSSIPALKDSSWFNLLDSGIVLDREYQAERKITSKEAVDHTAFMIVVTQKTVTIDSTGFHIN